jgi:hypothetical protein
MKLSNIYLVYGPKTRLVHIKDLGVRDLVNAIILHRENRGELFRTIIGHPNAELTPEQADKILAQRQRPSVLATEVVRQLRDTHFITQGVELGVVSPAQRIVHEHDAGRKIEGVIGHYPGELTPEAARGILAGRQRINQQTIERAEADMPEVKLAPAEIITLEPKRYEGLGSKKLEKNPPHVIDLTGRGEVKLLKLKVGFLRQFSHKKLVGDLLNCDGNISKSAGDLAGHMGIAGIKELLEIINSAKPTLNSQAVYLRLPTEAIVEVLVDVPKHRVHCDGLRIIPTASLYSPHGVNISEFEADITQSEIDGRLEFAFRSGSPDHNGPKTRMRNLPINASHLNTAVLEVVSIIDPLSSEPWV